MHTQERAKGKLNPEVRRRQVAHDMHAAKQYAADAKASSTSRTWQPAEHFVQPCGHGLIMRMQLRSICACGQ